MNVCGHSFCRETEREVMKKRRVVYRCIWFMLAVLLLSGTVTDGLAAYAAEEQKISVSEELAENEEMPETAELAENEEMLKVAGWPENTETAAAEPSGETDKKLYRGYSHEITAQGIGAVGLRIEDGQEADGEDRIVYCYDNRKVYPGKRDAGESILYSRIDNYLDSKDPYTEAYGADKKARIATALYAGYPYNAYGHLEEFGILPEEARYMTQLMIWDITENAEGIYGAPEPEKGISENMVKYYNAIYQDLLEDFMVKDEHLGGEMEITGQFNFHQEGEYWQTGKLHVSGSKGTVRFRNLAPHFEILEAYTMRPLQDIDMTQDFIIRSKVRPDDETSFFVEYQYERVKFYFYKYEKGGNPDSRGIQNLIRVEPSDILETSYFQIFSDGKKEEVGEDEIPEEIYISKTVRKEWVDAGFETQRPEGIYVQLYANGTACGNPAFLNGQNAWQYRWDGLKAEKNGVYIHYTVKETDVPAGYIAEVTENAPNADFVLKNIFVGNDAPEYDMGETYGTILLSKEVIGEGGDKSQPFTFEISLEEDGSPYNGVLAYSGGVKTGITGVNRPEDGKLEFKEGKAQIKLSHGQQITLEGIPLGKTMKYAVTESETDKAGYRTAYNNEMSPASGVCEAHINIHVINYKENISASPEIPEQSQNGTEIQSRESQTDDGRNVQEIAGSSEKDADVEINIVKNIPKQAGTIHINENRNIVSKSPKTADPINAAAGLGIWTAAAAIGLLLRRFWSGKK